MLLGVSWSPALILPLNLSVPFTVHLVAFICAMCLQEQLASAFELDWSAVLPALVVQLSMSDLEVARLKLLLAASYSSIRNVFKCGLLCLMCIAGVCECVYSCLS